MKNMIVMPDGIQTGKQRALQPGNTLSLHISLRLRYGNPGGIAVLIP
jgi:hypothetical protein